MGAVQSTTCWGETMATSCVTNCDLHMETGVSVHQVGWTPKSPRGKSADELWASMPVTALKVLESERIDPWSRAHRVRPTGRASGMIGGRHEKVVADTMGPEVVMMHRRPPGQKKRQRAPGRGRRARQRSSSKEQRQHGAPNTIYVDSQGYEANVQTGLGGMQSDMRWDSADESASSEETEGECDLQDPSTCAPMAAPPRIQQARCRPRRQPPAERSQLTRESTAAESCATAPEITNSSEYAEELFYEPPLDDLDFIEADKVSI